MARSTEASPTFTVKIRKGKLVLSDGWEGALAATGHLSLSKKNKLTELPTGLKVRRLELSGCTGLTRLPDGLEVRHLKVDGCTELTELPTGLRCYEIQASGSGLRSLPSDLRVDFRLDLRDCVALAELPAGLKVGSLVLRGCKSLASLPEGLDVNFLDLRDCDQIEAWPDTSTIRIGRLNINGCRRLVSLPAGLGRMAQLDVSDCTGLKTLPEGLEVGSWIEIANTGITSLPGSLAGAKLRWRGVPIDERIAFHPEQIAVSEVLTETNAERRRVLLERVGLDRFMDEAEVEVLDEDRDPGGVRRLFQVPLPGDEPIVCVMVHCPSTGGRYLLRVPPKMKTCHQAVAWTAGFDDPSLYRPLIEA
jgi:hypothetical protein